MKALPVNQFQSAHLLTGVSATDEKASICEMKYNTPVEKLDAGHFTVFFSLG